MAITTIEILAQQVTALAPDVPVLNPADPRITVDRSVLQTIRLIVPAVIECGNIDISTILLGVRPEQQGQPMLLIRGTVTSQGGAYAAGDAFLRQGPVPQGGGSPPNQQTLVDLSTTEGQYLGDPVELPINHTVGIDTQNGAGTGPHRIVLVAKFFEDDDAFSVT